MITVRLFGGLGNQLFQYAAGRALALRLGVGLALDRRYLPAAPAPFSYALGHFAIQALLDPAPAPPHKSRALAYGLWRLGLGRPKFLREQGLGVNARVLDAPDDSYLHGYFQSETYFADALPGLRDELAITTPPSDENADWLARISEDPAAVSLHLRRGDYVSGAKGGSTHGTCDADYYRRALAEIAARTGITPRAYVFSDDPGWVRANLDLGAEMAVAGHNGPSQHYEDLRLMAACRHHVIANSTFSWWGGWLDPRPGKIVVAPARWFANPKLSNPDILPAGWLRL